MTDQPAVRRSHERSIAARRFPQTARWPLVFLPLLLAAGWADGADERVLDPGMVHLGDSQTPEWTEAAPEPVAGRYELLFEAEANRSEHVLILAQRNVNDRWDVELNGRPIAELDRHEDLRDVLYALPPGTLITGQNVLKVVPSTTTDDITIGRARLVTRPMRELLDLQPVDLRVIDEDSGEPLPARITLVDEEGQPAQVYYAESQRTAVRPGVLYVGEGAGHLELPRGRYTVWATRGMEWGLAQEGRW